MDFIVKSFDELSTKELYEILKTRAEIFVVEQDCVYQDLDDKDQGAMHVFCWNDQGRVAGYLRVFMKDEENKVAQIGRVVTLEHGKGLGGKLLREGVEVAERSFAPNKIYLEAQKYAIGYYAKEGFEVVILNASCSDRQWAERFFFVEIESLGPDSRGLFLDTWKSEGNLLLILYVLCPS